MSRLKLRINIDVAYLSVIFFRISTIVNQIKLLGALLKWKETRFVREGVVPLPAALF